ncbi:membrane-bound lytic murein transglycosylase [Serpentinimonas maccroryi]|uniref:peptidoglycan lytic exotransglycosylase n=1 Tax=Serpentinimonas maccroryi TaxID=1458426 RepID=A0A060NT25_9BURK|nr:MltA domain-containing protein [Serpentinimonas maccroryi]BAO84500.1 membrane-bound lytic murein transglycosylase [Serpentinimonas maccroryi]
MSPPPLLLNALRPAPVWPTPSSPTLAWASRPQRAHLLLASLLAGLLLAGCATPPPVADAPAAAPAPLEAPPAPRVAVPEPPPTPGARPASGFDEIWPEPVLGPEAAVWQWAESQPLPAPLVRANSRWQPVRWSELPGWGRDALPQAWNAWLRSCERPAPTLGALCQEVRRLSIASASAQHEWMMRHLQPFRVQSLEGNPRGLLTGYYEPLLHANRVRQGPYQTPLHAVPPGLSRDRPWFSRQQMATDPQALAQLQGREIVWLADPLDALLLQIQGSGRVLVREPDGRQQLVRLAFAGHNGHPYRSVGRWLLDRGAIRAGTWEAIRAWAAAHPEQINEMLWSNPRTVFFREESLNELEAQFGPRGAQGVALTPGRSIAVDPRSIPYGTPVWLHSSGPFIELRRLVLAQDTGAAIVGAARADFFTGWGEQAFFQAAGIKQPVHLWALWPRSAP